MKTFIDLLDAQYEREAEDRSKWATAQIEALLSESALHFWSPRGPVPAARQRILIGIVPWSEYDLRLLDALNRVFSDRQKANERVDVFDLDAAARVFGTFDFLQDTIPGIGKIYQTPVVGIWEDGTLMQKASGATARELISRLYNLGRDEIMPRRK